MKTIKCSCGSSIELDDEDYERLNKYRFSCNGGAVAVRVGAAKFPPIGLIKLLGKPSHDHKDRNYHNNQKENLRPATTQRNNFNRGPSKGKRFKGVSWDKTGRKWAAKIELNGKRTFLGLFELEVDAAKAYNEAALKLHGDFAYQNPL